MEISEADLNKLIESSKEIKGFVDSTNDSIADLEHNLEILREHVEDILVVLGNIKFPVQGGPS
jgi:hypothetical protein